MADWTGTAGNDTFDGTALAESALGLGGNDTLNGGAGADTLNGGPGSDRLVGGNGNDFYTVDAASDVVVETVAAIGTGGRDRVNSYTAQYTLPANVEDIAIRTALASAATGNALANLLFAGAGDNTLDGAGGKDTASYFYAGAAVSVSLASDQPQATGGSGTDLLLRIENLTGSAHADTLTGNTAANVLDGGAGADTLSGGGGNDRYNVDSALDTLIETDPAGGLDTVYSRATAFTLADNIENLRIDTAAAADATGNGLANTVFAGAGANRLDGAGGIDTLSYTLAGAAVNVDLAIGGAQATGGSGSDTLAGFENLNGSRFADRLSGDGTANRLNGLGGADTLEGRGGDDTYVVDAAGDMVIEAVEGGTDTVLSTAAALTLAANVENLVIARQGTANATGNALANTVTAGAGDNVLDGAGGIDWLRYDRAAGGVTLDLSITVAQPTGGSGTDTVTRFENLAGSAHADSLAGGAGANTLDGLGGDDTLAGGNGDDTYFVDSAGDVVIETTAAAAGDADRVIASTAAVTLADNVEQLVLARADAADGTGNALDNLIVAGAGDNLIDGGAGIDRVDYSGAAGPVSVTLGVASATGGSGTDTLLRVEALQGSAFADTLNGTAGPNTLDGGAGNDTLSGGAGNDTYHVDTSADSVIETTAGAAGGVDLVVSSATAFTLGGNLENLRIAAAGNASVQGNSLANTLFAGSGNNTLAGGAGEDTASYADSAAGVSVDLALGGAQATGGSGSDTLLGIEHLAGSAGADALYGSSGANQLAGRGGDDLLAGRGGDDTLSGGAGADSFRFDSKPSANKNVDLLTDFTPGEDRIVLENAVFSALSTTGPLAAAQLVLGTAAQDPDDHLIYDATTGSLYYDANGSGRGARVLIAVLGETTHPLLSAADVLVS